MIDKVPNTIFTKTNKQPNKEKGFRGRPSHPLAPSHSSLLLGHVASPPGGGGCIARCWLWDSLARKNNNKKNDNPGIQLAASESADRTDVLFLSHMNQRTGDTRNRSASRREPQTFPNRALRSVKVREFLPSMYDVGRNFFSVAFSDKQTKTRGEQDLPVKT